MSHHSSSDFPKCSAHRRFGSLGTTAWKGLPMYSTFETRIGGKDVILDRQIASSELPTIVGKAQLEYADAHDEENDDGSAPVSILMQPNAVAAREGNTSPSMKNSDGSAKKFIAPQTFYGKPAPKPAPKGPLYVVYTMMRSAIVLTDVCLQPRPFGGECNRPQSSNKGAREEIQQEVGYLSQSLSTLLMSIPLQEPAHCSCGLRPNDCSASPSSSSRG